MFIYNFWLIELSNDKKSEVDYYYLDDALSLNKMRKHLTDYDDMDFDETGEFDVLLVQNQIIFYDDALIEIIGDGYEAYDEARFFKEYNNVILEIIKGDTYIDDVDIDYHDVIDSKYIPYINENIFEIVYDVLDDLGDHYDGLVSKYTEFAVIDGEFVLESNLTDDELETQKIYTMRIGDHTPNSEKNGFVDLSFIIANYDMTKDKFRGQESYIINVDADDTKSMVDEIINIIDYFCRKV